MLQLGAPRVACARPRRERLGLRCSAVHGAYTVLGTSRKQNEDRWTATPTLKLASDGSSVAYYGVFDGHGGNATSQWLADKLAPLVGASFSPTRSKESIEAVFEAADEQLLAPQGFMGMGARGIGGPKCGSTGLVALVYGSTLLVANCGDARAVLCVGGVAEQLSIDHVPDDENERYRIELRNPNPRKPLVTYVGSAWRVGGLLALSRAFGDAYMKASGNDEGYGTAQDDYGSGFGVIPKPHVAMRTTVEQPAFLVLSSDGLYSNEERGGGGGLTNERVGEMCAAAPADASAAQLSALAEAMATEAVANGSTDDVTVLIVRL